MTTATRPADTTVRTLCRTGGVLLLLNALLHVVEGPEYLEEEAYIGVLFFVGAALLLVAGVQLLRRDDPRSWLVGVVISVGMLVAGVLSRTTGLPSFKESEWEPTLIVAFVLELLFLGVYAARARRTTTSV